MSTFVSVGNATQPFDRLLQGVANHFSSLPQPVFVQRGCGNDIFQGTCISVPFISMDEFSEHVRNARLIILHGGAGSIINAVRAGKVPLVVPRRSRFGELVDDHQVELARELASSGKIILCEDVGELLSAADQAIRLQSHADSRQSSNHLIKLVRHALTHF